MRWLITIDAVTRIQIVVYDSLQPHFVLRTIRYQLYSPALMRSLLRQLVQCILLLDILRHLVLTIVSSNQHTHTHAHFFGIRFVLLQPRFGCGRPIQISISTISAAATKNTPTLSNENTRLAPAPCNYMVEICLE